MATDDKIIGVHLDLKGVMMRPRYLGKLLGDLAAQDVNTVLVEYEDIFPFEGIDVAWDSAVRWSPETLSSFQRAAAEHGIQIIPLQQCLGHLEYVFRWERYRELAEDPSYPSTVKLSEPRAKALVRDMLEQVVEAHPDSPLVHLGMDEAHAMVTSRWVRAQGDVLQVFLDYLEELCNLVESHDKTPIIWTDMLEDHFRPDAFERLRDRVIFAPWDYSSSGPVQKTGRLCGMRVRRKWLDEPENPEAPRIGPGTRFIEDLPPEVMSRVQPWLTDDGFQTLFQVDLWTSLGFRVLGATVVRSSSHLAVLPDYNRLAANIEAWGAAIRRTDQMGLIGTSWARGTTFCPPGFNFDLSWPVIGDLARALGGRPAPFWPELPEEKVRMLVKRLGRCKQDWRLEGQIAETMAELADDLCAHQHEWRSIELMARVLELHRRAEFACEEVDFFHANNRPVDSEWQRRLDDQEAILRSIDELRKLVRGHFGERYYGDAFEEWMADLFDLWEQRLRDCRSICEQKKTRAKKIYGG